MNQETGNWAMIQDGPAAAMGRAATSSIPGSFVMKVAITLRVMSPGRVTRSVTATFMVFHCKDGSGL